jgi:hypothetical protein
MAKKQQRRRNAERSPTARKRDQSFPIVFNFGGSDIEIVFEDGAAPAGPARSPQSNPNDAEGETRATFMNNPG